MAIYFSNSDTSGTGSGGSSIQINPDERALVDANGNRYSHVFPLSPPRLGDFNTLGPGTFVDDVDGVRIIDRGHAGDSLKMAIKPWPSTTPRSVTLSFHALMTTVGNTDGGLCLRDSTTGRILTFAWRVGYGLASHRFNSPTAYGGAQLLLLAYNRLPRFFGVHDDGVNLIFRVSGDGITWTTVRTETRTTWLSNGGDEAGFYVNAVSGSAHDHMIWAYHFEME